MNYFRELIKRPYLNVDLLGFLALLLCSVQPAGAAPISASASIDWSTFKITSIDIGNGLPSLSWNYKNDYSQASVGYYGGGISDSASNWSTGTLATQSGSTSNSSGSASASTSVNEIKADASLSFFNPYLYANSNSQRYGSFTVHGNGLLLFHANYSLAGDVGKASNTSASSNVGFNLYSNNDGGYGSVNQSFSRYLSSGMLPFAETGNLDVAMVFKDGWSGNFSANTSTSLYGSEMNSVPLPAAFWLFGSALAGVAALRRPNSSS